ncbi:MAG: hypothetical protein GXO04_04840, partial [Aquificae bacterium]|nr:hypothetical protein [Aquificota bacterium]
MRILLLLLSLLYLSFSLEVKLGGPITDIAVQGDKVAVSTENGKVYILSAKDLSVSAEIDLPEFTDFTGEKQKAKVFSVDLSPSSQKALIVVEDNLGKRSVYVYENGSLTPVLKLVNASRA